MSKKNSRKWKRAGFTLITALAFSLIVGTVLAGIGSLSMSHFGRSKVEGSYANAVALADAGINYEFRWVSLDPTQVKSGCTTGTPGCPDQFPGYTGSVAGVPGTYTVYVHDWANGSCTGTWTNPLGDVCVQATGTVDGISRTVRVHGIHKSVFDEFAIFAISSGTFNGGGAQGQSSIVGDMGTNGQVKFNGSTNTGYVNGTLYYNGSGTQGDPAGSNTATNSDAVKFPTVSDWANKLFPSGGLTYLQTNNSNANIKQLKSTDTALVSEPTIAGLTLADVNSKLDSAGYTAASRNLTDPTNSTPSDTSALDNSASPSSSWRFVFPGGLSGVTVGSFGTFGKRLLIFPPGDYYFTSMSLKGGTTGLLFLTHLGPIHIWIDNPSSGPNKQDDLSTSAVFTDYTPSKFRIFYNKCNQLNMTGSSVFPGGFYAVNPACGPTNPMMNIGGNGAIFGSVITQYFTVGGTTQIVFPNNAGGDPTDFALWFGFKDNWKEVSTNGNPVFVDGTSN